MKHFTVRLGKSLYPDGVIRDIRAERRDCGTMFRFISFTDDALLHQSTFITTNFVRNGDLVRIPYWRAQQQDILEYGQGS